MKHIEFIEFVCLLMDCRDKNEHDMVLARPSIILIIAKDGFRALRNEYNNMRNDRKPLITHIHL